MSVQRLPTDDFVTPQGVGSKTFVQPPMDGSFNLPMMVDWHGHRSAQHAWAVYPKGDGELQTVTWRHLSVASQKMAAMLKTALPVTKTDEAPVIGVLANRDHLTYNAMVVGLLRAGCVAFLISPRNALGGVLSMLRASNAVAVISSSDYLEKTLVDGVLAEMPHLIQVEAPLYDDLFDLSISLTDPYVPLLPEMTTPMDNNATALIIHSSGSTAFPKPIPLSHLGVLQWIRISNYSYQDSCGKRVGIQSAPSFHGMGFFHCISTPASSGCHVAVFKPQEPPVKPNPHRVLAAWRETKIQIATGPPSNLVAWIQDPSAVEFLKTLDWVRVGGGPLPTPTGDALVAQGVRLLNGWGTTEVGVLSQPGPPEPYGADWEYIQLTANAKPIFEPHGEGVYEICFPCTRTHIPSVFNDHVNRIYRTSDLCELHPTRKGFFRIVGRTDDQLMLSTGEKTNPGPMESIIRGSPLVNGAIYFGRGKFQNGVLIEPSAGNDIDTSDPAQVARFRNNVWSYVAQANSIAPTHSRVFKEMILVCSKDRPLLLTPKGSVSRPKSLSLYDAEVEAIYAALEDASSGAVKAPSVFDFNTSLAYVKAVASEIMRPQGGEVDDRDLFLQGCDSLQATVLRIRLLNGLRESGKALEPPPANWIYANSTLRSLSDSVLLAATTGSFAPASSDPAVRVKLVEDTVEQYCQDFPKHTGTQATPARKTVLLTGTTGTLGSYLLQCFMDDPQVELVYAVNRPSTKPALERQKEALVDRGIDLSLLQGGRVVVVEADLSRADFGISSELMEKMRNSVTLIVHNAWRLDFNLSLGSFIPNIEGVRNLVNFALSSPFVEPPMIVNTSSVSVVSAHPTGWVAETSANPLYTAPTGYGQSKFVAEKILERAPLKSCSVRIGQLSGSTINGAWNVTDWLPMLIKSGEAEACGCLPAGNDDVAWMPTDSAAVVITEFCKSADLPETLHLVHPLPIKWSTMIQYFSRALGVQTVAFEYWIKRLAGNEDPVANPAIKILPFFKAKPLTPHGTPGREAVGIPRVQTQLAVKHSETLASLPPIDEQDFRSWLSYWKTAGLILS